MKITREQKFTPVTIVLESEEELGDFKDTLRAAVTHVDSNRCFYNASNVKEFYPMIRRSSGLKHVF